MFNSEALEWQPAGAQKGAGEGLGVGSFQGCPPLNVGGCRELGQAAAAPTNPLGWAAEMLPVLLGTMQDVGQEWGDISQPGGAKTGSQVPPPQGCSTDRSVRVHPLPAPASTHSRCHGQLSAQGQHIRDLSLLFTLSHCSQKYPLAQPISTSLEPSAWH